MSISESVSLSPLAIFNKIPRAYLIESSVRSGAIAACAA